MAETNLEPERGTTSYKVSDKTKTKPAPIDISAAQAMAGSYEKTDKIKVTTPRSKLGHRRVDEKGETTYKKTPSSALMSAIQLGIGFTVGRLSAKQERDVLMQDFAEIETVWFPSEGTKGTPSHKFSDFRFKSYAPVAFRFFRDLFSMKPDDFMMSLCNEPLLELSNPGASGSLFYVTCDNQFIIKTVDHKEADFLQKLLPGYYLNLNQNKKTLLPKFFGLFCYQCGGKNIRLVIMNNLLPTVYKFHWKYDLKGSTYKRRASKAERAKATPTKKDLDFLTDHPEGIFLEPDTYNSLVRTIQRDCRVLESFKIMDYSLLLAIHNLDEAQRERHQDGTLTPSGQMTGSTQEGQTTSLDLDNSTNEHKEGDQLEAPENPALQRSKSLKGREGFNTAWEAITVKETGERPYGGIPARNAKGERLLLFIGVIDILQSYRLKKKLEHGWKSIVHDGDTVSVHRPSFYSKRFLEFMSTKVFKKLQGKEKTSPRKRSLGAGLGRVRSMTEADRSRSESRRDRTLTGEISTSLRSRSRSLNEGRGASEAGQKRKSTANASHRLRQNTEGSLSTRKPIEQSAEDAVSTIKDNTEPHKGSPDSGIPPSPRNDSVSNAPTESTTQKEIITEITNNSQDIMHAQDKDTNDKLESSVHISDQVANVDGENPKNSEKTVTLSEETRKESDNVQIRTVWDRPWNEDDAGDSRKEYITQETEQP